MEESIPIYTLESSVNSLTVIDDGNYLTIKIKEQSGGEPFSSIEEKARLIHRAVRFW